MRGPGASCDLRRRRGDQLAVANVLQGEIIELQLAKKVALVTGSAAGIGHAIAACGAREGASVIVNGRTHSALDAAVARLRADTGGEVSGFAADLSRASDAEADGHA